MYPSCLSLSVNTQRLAHVLQQFLAQPTAALVFACPHFVLQLFLTASLGSSLLILQRDIFHFLFTILKALTFFPEVKSPTVHALSSSTSGRAWGCQRFQRPAGTGQRNNSPLWDCWVYSDHPPSMLHSLKSYSSIGLYYLAPAAGYTDG